LIIKYTTIQYVRLANKFFLILTHHTIPIYLLKESNLVLVRQTALFQRLHLRSRITKWDSNADTRWSCI